jgi:hypothetical protein
VVQTAAIQRGTQGLLQREREIEEITCVCNWVQILKKTAKKLAQTCQTSEKYTLKLRMNLAVENQKFFSTY